MSASAPHLIAIMGPTGAGKTDVAERLGSEIDALLINADAFQVYRGMDIGTAKPHSRERYRLLDIRDPNEPFSLGAWLKLTLPLLAEAFEAHRNVIVVGGTGLYIRALMEEYQTIGSRPSEATRQAIQKEIQAEGLESVFERLKLLDSDRAASIDSRNPIRVQREMEKILEPQENLAVHLPPFKRTKIGIEPNLGSYSMDISRRVASMLENGWQSEVRSLLEKGFGISDPGFRAIGYRTITRVICGDIAIEDASEEITKETLAYAKRQRTWLRKEPALISVSAEEVKSSTRALHRALS